MRDMQKKDLNDPASLTMRSFRIGGAFVKRSPVASAKPHFESSFAIFFCTEQKFQQRG